MGDNIEELAEKLEKDEEDVDGWDHAHHRYENGNPEMLENMAHGRGLWHEIATRQKLKYRNGRNIDYDKADTSITAFVLTTLSFKFHPLGFTALTAVAYLIYRNSIRKVESDSNIYKKIDQFGMELPYYIIAALLTAYFFAVIQGDVVVLENSGTLITFAAEVFNYVAG